MPRHFNVLFLCTGNSARSIMAEAILNKKGFPNFTAYGAGSHPTGHVNPEAIKQLETAELPTVQLRSKGWDEFGRSGAPEMHFVLLFATVLRPRSARSGLGTRISPNGACQIPQQSRVHLSKSSAHFSSLSQSWTGALLCFLLCRFQTMSGNSFSARSIA